MQNETLLNWLQDFYLENHQKFNLDNLNYKNDFNVISKDIPEGGILINTIANPGFNLCFNCNNLSFYKNEWKNYDCNTGVNYHEDLLSCNQWLFAKKDKKMFEGGGGPLFLGVLLYAFKCFIEGIPFVEDDLPSIKAKLYKDNELLCWIEQFYFSCCDSDWERMYGYKLYSVSNGWIVILSLDEYNFSTKPYERFIEQDEYGRVECFKLDTKFIIKTHFGGLIKGLSEFRNWVES